MSVPILTESPHYCKIEVHHGEDWYDPLPRLVDPMTVDPDDPESGESYDITSVALTLIIRPSFNHLTRFIVISTNPPSGTDYEIIKESPTGGLAAIFAPMEDVEELLPLSQTAGWRHFLRLSFTDPDLGPVTKILWKGPLIVFPARDAATV